MPRPRSLFPRHAETMVRAALRDTRIVVLVGPRQSGKTTLARRVAGSRPYLTLDDEQTRTFALEDPTGFVRDLDHAVIDEIQRAPALLLALKKSVDEDPRPGRFLVTGSAALLESMLAPDSLAGRVQTIELLPLSQAEIQRQTPPSFLDDAFKGKLRSRGAPAAITHDLVPRVLAGGFPEALARRKVERRREWFRAYAQALATRDIRDLAGLDKGGALPQLVAHASVASGRLLNLTELAAHVAVDAKTADRWLGFLQLLYLVQRVPAWSGSALKRLIRAPKLHFIDSGLLAALQGVDAHRIARDRTALGPLLESFVFGELRKAVATATNTTSISHYRDKDQLEVDFVLERSPGQLVGVEVKATATVRPEDFRGLARLRDAAGAGFSLGVLLHDGERVTPFGDRLVAAPFSVLWESAGRRRRNPASSA